MEKMITEKRIVVVVTPHAGASRTAIYAAALAAAMNEFAIVTVNRASMFLANVLHESGAFRLVEEDLFYQSARLRKVWPKRFPDDATASIYARNPERLANFVYANREGNGDVGSGDGWRFRGAGLKQITFRNNHAACAKHFKIPLNELAAWLRTPEGAARSAAWYWHMSGCDKFADAGDFDGVCDKINIGHKTQKQGDAIGFAFRKTIFEEIKKAMS